MWSEVISVYIDYSIKSNLMLYALVDGILKFALPDCHL